MGKGGEVIPATVIYWSWCCQGDYRLFTYCTALQTWMLWGVEHENSRTNLQNSIYNSEKIHRVQTWTFGKGEGVSTKSCCQPPFSSLADFAFLSSFLILENKWDLYKELIGFGLILYGTFFVLGLILMTSFRVTVDFNGDKISFSGRINRSLLCFPSIFLHWSDLSDRDVCWS